MLANEPRHKIHKEEEAMTNETNDKPQERL